MAEARQAVTARIAARRWVGERMVYWGRGLPLWCARSLLGHGANGPGAGGSGGFVGEGLGVVMGVVGPSSDGAGIHSGS